MLDLQQFKIHVVRPVIRSIGLYSPAAEKLLLCTALVESNMTYIKQIGKGPALGLFQMEPNTHDDIWVNFLRYKPELAKKVAAHAIRGQGSSAQLMGNMEYATAMARVHYFRKREPLPHENDIEGMARYWKNHYNTYLGAGTIDGFKRKTSLLF